MVIRPEAPADADAVHRVEERAFGRPDEAALVRRGLAECRAAGHDCAVVLGEPGYYHRFGFETAARHRVRCEFDALEEAFMIVALRPGALVGVGGLARYEPEFGAVA